MGYDMATKEKNVGWYKRVYLAAQAFFSRVEQPMPDALKGKTGQNEAKIVQEYEQLVKLKDQEIQKQSKQLIKDSLRISIKELGQIQYVNGHLHEATQQWVKSLDLSSSPEDIFQMNYYLAFCAYNFDHDFKLQKFA
mmetsp:Transcript_32790/g.50053  ORF Transcript_32790/g.50053 Transcript_32790/m.50053 type:complete len:137 (+) Transcript_32790:166-576(+)